MIVTDEKQMMLYFFQVCVYSYLVSIIATILFFKTMPKGDLEKFDKPDHKIAIHTGILAYIVSIADWSVFIHSAILIAIFLTRYL